MTHLPQTGFLRLNQIIGDKKTNTPALMPISRSAWWAGVKEGRYPRGVKLSPRTTGWPVESIQALIENTSAAAR